MGSDHAGRIDRDDLLARVDLETVLDALSPGPPLRRGPGAKWRCIDPDHPDRHPSVTTTSDRHGVQRWRCWSGGHGGTAIDAVMLARRMPVGDAIRWLNDNYAHLDIIQRPPPPEPRPVGDPHPAVLKYIDRCARLLWTPAGRPMRDWLHRRGLHDDTLRANLVGADPGRHYLPRPRRGFPAGSPAVVYPALDPDGRPVYFQARYLDPPPPRDKYDNPSRHWATNPKVAWAQPPTDAPRSDDLIVVTEGTADALTAAQAGFAAVGILGSSYPDRTLLAQIRRTIKQTDTILICFDNDPAGLAGAHRLQEACESQPNLVLRPPEGMDLTEWAERRPTWHEQVASGTLDAPRFVAEQTRDRGPHRMSR